MKLSGCFGEADLKVSLAEAFVSGTITIWIIVDLFRWALIETSPLPHTIRFRPLSLTVTSPCPRTFGFCYLYPFSHRLLFEEILATITLIIASKRTGLVPSTFHFPSEVMS